MTRDYKYYGTRQKQKPRLGWAIVTLAVGVGVGIGVALYLKKPAGETPAVTAVAPAPVAQPVAPPPKQEERQRYDFYTLLPEMEVVVPADGAPQQGAKPPPDTVKPATPAAAPSATNMASVAPPAAARPAATPVAAAPAAAPARKPQVPAPTTTASLSPQPAPAAAPTGEVLYVLQAGSFLQVKSAESLKANLALLGVQSTIQPVAVGDETWHRVFIGPYKDAAYAAQLQQQLRNNQINAQLMKVDRR